MTSINDVFRKTPWFAAPDELSWNLPADAAHIIIPLAPCPLCHRVPVLDGELERYHAAAAAVRCPCPGGQLQGLEPPKVCDPTQSGGPWR